VNIIWQKPDSTIAVTHILESYIANARANLVSIGVPSISEKMDVKSICQSHAEDLISRGDIPLDWVAVAYNCAIPAARDAREDWVWDAAFQKVIPRTCEQG
jgi:hypothetical protein